jgi:hypothetical protein
MRRLPREAIVGAHERRTNERCATVRDASIDSFLAVRTPDAGRRARLGWTRIGPPGISGVWTRGNAMPSCMNAGRLGTRVDTLPASATADGGAPAA